MPVFTGAAIAIGAAIATTTVATVATAVVATSIAVGVMGVAVTAVGMITKNQDLLKAGKIMGYVGLAGGLAGGVIGGAGGLMEGGTGFMEGAKGAYTGASEAMSQGWKEGLGSFFSPETAGTVVGPAPEGGTIGTTNGVGNNLPAIGGQQPTSLTGLPAVEAPLDAGQTATTLGQNGSIPTAASPSPMAPSISTPMPGQVATPALPNVEQAITAARGPFDATATSIANMGAPASSAGGGILDSISTLPDWVKYSAMNTGGQGLSGAMSGWYAGASAEQKLAFDQLVNNQRQGQVNLTNDRGGYAPKLTFNGPTGPAGIVQTR